MRRGGTQRSHGHVLGHLDLRAGRSVPPELVQAVPCAGGKSRRLLSQVEIAPQLGQADEMSAILAMARSDAFEESALND
jgi:hypothetical protein